MSWLAVIAAVLAGWQPIDGPATRGFQELAPVRVGDEVVVIAGVDYDQATIKGLVVDLSSGQARRTAPSRQWWMYGQSAVAARRRVIVWGGCHGPAGRGRRAAGAVYDVRRDRWTPLWSGPRRTWHTAVWTGEEMLVWGGSTCRGRPRADGAAWDGSWRRIARAPLSRRAYHVAVWTGEEMLVWGGSRGRRLLVDGAAYDPERDRWRRLAPAPLVGGTLGYGEEPDLDAEWTGELMTMWTGNRGAVYDPGRDRWEPIPPYDVTGQTAWTAAELLVWGLDGGAAYDPRTGAWRALPDAPIRGRDRHATVSIPGGMLVWGGCCRRSRYYGDGAILRTRP